MIELQFALLCFVYATIHLLLVLSDEAKRKPYRRWKSEKIIENDS